MVESGDYVWELFGRSGVQDTLTGKTMLGEAMSYGLHPTDLAAALHGTKLVEDETIIHFTIAKRRIH